MPGILPIDNSTERVILTYCINLSKCESRTSAAWMRLFLFVLNELQSVKVTIKSAWTAALISLKCICLIG